MSSFFRKHIFDYQVFILIMYLVAITTTESMKITLPIYIVFSTLPYLAGFYEVEKPVFIILSIAIVYIFVGVLFQDKVETLTSFFSKTYQFIAFMLFLGGVEKYSGEILLNSTKLMKICIIAETVLGAYIISHATFVSNTGVARITAGRQPVGGNLSIVMIPIVFFTYFRNEKQKGKILALSIFSVIWIILSGTRGYLLLYAISMAPVFLDYFFSLSYKSRNRVIMGTIFLLSCIVLGVILLQNNSNWGQKIIRILRLEAGTGSRKSENRIALQFFFNTSIRYKLFGVGYGGIPADAPYYLEAVSSNVSTSWSYSNYARRVGVSFHNLFSNFLLLQGLVGIIEIVLIFLWGLSKIRSTKTTCQNERRCIYLYWIGFFIMNCFRWSCDCGISEMIVFAIVLGLLRRQQALDSTYH